MAKGKVIQVPVAPPGAAPGWELKEMLDSYGLPQTRDGAVELVLCQYGAEKHAGERRRIGKLSTRILKEILFDTSH